MDMGGQLAARAQQARSSYRFADTVTGATLTSFRFHKGITSLT